MSNRLGAMDSGAVAATSEAKLNDLRICKFKSILPLPYTSIDYYHICIAEYMFGLPHVQGHKGQRGVPKAHGLSVGQVYKNSVSDHGFAEELSGRQHSKEVANLKKKPFHLNSFSQ